MKRKSIIFLQSVVVLIAIATIAFMIWSPQAEGRAKNLDLFSIYTDPFILYVYAASTVYFIALYKTFRLLGYIGQNDAFSSNSIIALKNIKYCSLILCGLILLAGLYLKISNINDDDTVGVLFISTIAAFASIVVAIVAGVLKGILKNGLDIKSENIKLSSC